ncbi:GNAT family N-acetyltransferase [Kibdelosporangium aridum]|uniref:N-acetyltransferase domain-containing protein n=1 Tax=Kibdelosporangium aridum TaxID=2030 RepID=A0A1W2FRK2_KIBAR|nr:GNAT family N-acetyltransferase [Kibdelosporangium aridum]SMD24597.1 hypothetical protein SAMN05661093_08670 [Kibdelosporangium aridum]
MVDFRIAAATADDMVRFRDWADDLCWNPGDSDRYAFFPVDPRGFLIGRLDGEPVASISAVRYGSDYGVIGHHIVRDHVRGCGYGRQLWQAALDRLAGRTISVDGRGYPGFRRAWTTIRYEGVPTGLDRPRGLSLVDARSVPFDQIAAYDRLFFPAPRDAFLASWVSLPGHTAVAAIRDGHLHGFAVMRPASGAHRIGPVYADSQDVALALVIGLSACAPGRPVCVDVPDINECATILMEKLGLRQTSESTRLYRGPVPDVDLVGQYAVTSVELG